MLSISGLIKKSKTVDRSKATESVFIIASSFSYQLFTKKYMFVERGRNF